MPSSKPSSNRLRRTALSLAILLGFACGPGPSDLNEFMSYFMPESSNANPQDRLFFFTPQLYNYDAEIATEGTDSLVVDDNMRAWHTYTQHRLSDKALHEGLYGSTANNALTQYLKANNAPALAYLKVAYEANQAAPAPADAWTPSTTDTTRLTGLLEQVKTAYKTTADAFLKERYAYQAVKLAHQIGDHEQSQSLYDQLVKPLPNKTFISDWALCRRAGADFAVGDTAQAIYGFAQVFDRCPSRRKEAEASLRIYGLRFQEKALTYARNDQEKAAVYALCAIQPKQDALPFLEEIVKLTPTNPLIELILAREINRNEYFFFETTNPIYVEDEKTRADSILFENHRNGAASYFDNLKAFALEAADNKALTNPAYYLTAAAYLDYLAKDYSSANATLEKAARQPTNNDVLKKQITLQQMLLLAADNETITPEIETKLVGFLEHFGKSDNFRLNNVFVKVCQQFANRYRGSSEKATASWWFSCSRPTKTDASDVGIAKAYLLTMLTTHELGSNNGYFENNIDQLSVEDTTSAATARKLVSFANQPTLSDVDKRLLKLTGFDNNYLYALLGRRLMAEHHYAEAAEAFANVSANTWKDEPYTSYFALNPFTINMPKENPSNPYTPVTFAQKMAELQRQAGEATGDKAAELYYQLGCGAYNLSWYGNAWLLVRRYRSSAEPNVYRFMPYRGPVDEKGLERLAQDTYYTTAPAKTFFEEAVKAAKSPELAAKAAYMAARCEENAFATRRAIEQAKHGYDADPESFNNEMEALREKQFATLFTQYRKQYTNSRFHAEMIRECALYSAFLAGETANPGE